MAGVSPASDPLSSASLFPTAWELHLLRFLADHGAFTLQHTVHHPLGSHLMGTCGILTMTAQPIAICQAGGIHSVYGTIRFHHSLFDSANEEHRALVQREIGEEAERLSFLFHSINRPRGLDEPSTLARWQHQQKDSEQPTPVTLDDDTLRSLRLVDAANLLEQGEADVLERLPNIDRLWHSVLPPALKHSPSASPEFFARYFHFLYAGVHAPCVKLTSLNVAAFPVLVQQSLAAPQINFVRVPKAKEDAPEMKQQTPVGWSPRTTLPFSAEILTELSSNAPCKPGCTGGDGCVAYVLE